MLDKKRNFQIRKKRITLESVVGFDIKGMPREIINYNEYFLYLYCSYDGYTFLYTIRYESTKVRCQNWKEKKYFRNHMNTQEKKLIRFFMISSSFVNEEGEKPENQ